MASALQANSEDVTIGPRTFCACPLDVEESRSWFITQWNENLVRYMVTVATEGVKVSSVSVVTIPDVNKT